MVPFWIPIIIRRLNLGYPKRDYNFDNHPYTTIIVWYSLFVFQPASSKIFLLGCCLLFLDRGLGCLIILLLEARGAQGCLLEPAKFVNSKQVCAACGLKPHDQTTFKYLCGHFSCCSRGRLSEWDRQVFQSGFTPKLSWYVPQQVYGLGYMLVELNLQQGLPEGVCVFLSLADPPVCFPQPSLGLAMEKV